MCIIEMGSADNEGFLNLSLNVITDSENCSPKKLKRKDREEILEWDLNESYEDNIFSLLEMREKMLNLEKNKTEDTENAKGLDLLHSLIISATCAEEKNMNSAVDNLCFLYQNISLFGDSLQRVAAYFADGLVAKLLTRKSPFYDAIMENPTPKDEFLAYTELYQVSPFHQFAHFTANQTIIEAYEDEEPSNNRALHVIDFDILYGFQWPSLIQSLSESATPTKPISLKITGFGRTLKELKETESRLVLFAKGYQNIVFEFQGLLRGSQFRNLIKSRKNETVAVNLMLTEQCYSNLSETLTDIQLINPTVLVMVEQEGNRTSQKFLARFMESLHYFAAMFDSLDDCLPANSKERLMIEKNHLGKEIKNLMNNEKENRTCSKYKRMETSWKGSMESHGLMASKMSSKCLIQARLLLKIRSNVSPVQIDGGNGGFRILEKDEGQGISLGWQDRRLITVSVWHCIE